MRLLHLQLDIWSSVIVLLCSLEATIVGGNRAANHDTIVIELDGSTAVAEAVSVIGADERGVTSVIGTQGEQSAVAVEPQAAMTDFAMSVANITATDKRVHQLESSAVSHAATDIQHEEPMITLASRPSSMTSVASAPRANSVDSLVDFDHPAATLVTSEMRPNMVNTLNDASLLEGLIATSSSSTLQEKTSSIIYTRLGRRVCALAAGASAVAIFIVLSFLLPVKTTRTSGSEPAPCIAVTLRTPRSARSPRTPGGSKLKLVDGCLGAAPSCVAEAPPLDSEDQLKLVRKEGGKRGVEIEGAGDLGGMRFFCTSLHVPRGDVELLVEGMAAMNAKPPKTTRAHAERVGCSGHLAKIVFSASERQVAVVSYVPKGLHQKLSAETWIREVVLDLQGQVLQVGELQCTAVAEGDGEELLLAMKRKATDVLVQKQLMPEDHAHDGDVEVFGDDDAAGVRRWHSSQAWVGSAESALGAETRGRGSTT